jgi:single-strand DNA-binding protein
MLNRVILIGRLTRDPELRVTQSGISVATFSVAVDRPYSSQGQRETDFIDCVAWRRLAETVSEHMRKGRLVAVEGRLQIRSYETQDGQRRRVAEVVCDDVRFLDRPRDGGGPGAAPGPEPGRGSEEDEELPEDLPF